MSCFDSTHAPVATALPLQQQLALLIPGSCACRPGLTYQVCCTWNERLETGIRTTSTRIVQYCCCCTYIVVAHIPVSLLNPEASPAGFFLPLAQTHQNPGGKAIWFFMRKASTFLKTYFRKHSSDIFLIKKLKNVSCEYNRLNG